MSTKNKIKMMSVMGTNSDEYSKAMAKPNGLVLVHTAVILLLFCRIMDKKSLYNVYTQTKNNSVHSWQFSNRFLFRDID